MKLRIATLLLAIAAAGTATARNVIREWGPHDPNDYTIVRDFQGNDVGVVIYANTHAWLLWKFEAYSGATDEPGYINYIRIADGVTVGDIRLSVIGQLPHLHGAAQLKSFDLSTNGTSTNKLEELDITGDFGALGPMQAAGAGTVTIAGRGVVACGLRSCGLRAPEATGPQARGSRCGAAVRTPAARPGLSLAPACGAGQDVGHGGPTLQKGVDARATGAGARSVCL